MTTQTPSRTAPRAAPRPAVVHTRTPSTDTVDMALRMRRAERRVDALAAAVRLLCDEAATPVERRAATLASAMLDDVHL